MKQKRARVVGGEKGLGLNEETNWSGRFEGGRMNDVV